MENWTFIYPHQLFIDQPAIVEKNQIALIEHPHFFTKFQFHKQKIIYHRATMKDYFIRLQKSGYDPIYIEFDQYDKFLKKLSKCTIHICDPIEKELNQELKQLKKTHAITLYPSPMFLTPKEFIDEQFEKKEHFSMASFYIAQRKRMNILIQNGQPVGGKWSFDTENRKPLPKNHQLPETPLLRPNELVKEAVEYVKHHFSTNPGASDCYLPIDHESAEEWLSHFLKEKLHNFGEFEDAIVLEDSFLYHSVLSPLLNIGLLTPQQVVDETIKYAQKHKVSLNSLEGFIRQIIGWREFMKITYDFKGDEMKKSNFFKHSRKLPKSYWDASTKIGPIDHVITKVLNYAYCHHIERLMILGNFMLLSKFDPKQVYIWFMEMFIDAYDWVMVPNVFAMSQYADGGQITTKPYVSSSNYVIKMSHFAKGPWCEIWDALYWEFIKSHLKIFAKNPRMTMMLSLYEKMDVKKKQHLHEIANNYLNLPMTKVRGSRMGL
jgi:deoxyribodipyrimidine photolyase-related protein